MPPARQQQSIAPCSEPERWGLPNHTLHALVASLTGSRPESAKSSPESPVVAPGKSGGHAGNLGYFRGNFGSCGRVGGRSPGHFRHLLCSFRALCLVAGVAVIYHGGSAWFSVARDLDAAAEPEPEREVAKLPNTSRARSEATPRCDQTVALSIEVLRHAWMATASETSVRHSSCPRARNMSRRAARSGRPPRPSCSSPGDTF